jgi:hypothetical protein
MQDWYTNEGEVFRTVVKTVYRIGFYDKLMSEKETYYHGIAEEYWNRSIFASNFVDIVRIF